MNIVNALYQKLLVGCLLAFVRKSAGDGYSRLKVDRKYPQTRSAVRYKPDNLSVFSMKSWQPEHKLLCRSMDDRVLNRVRECSHVKCLKIYVATSWLSLMRLLVLRSATV